MYGAATFTYDLGEDVTSTSAVPANRRQECTDLVTIVIPCFNQAHFLHDAIESALRQTHLPCEVIVVDDGSSDRTAAVAAGYDGVTCIRQQNAGLPAARNRGLEATRSEFVIFLDADDRLLPEAAEVGLSHLAGRPDCAFVSGEHRYIDTAGVVVQEWSRPPVSRDHYASLLQSNYIGMIATVVFRADVVRGVSGFDRRYRACEDYDLYLRIARQHQVCAHATPVAEYRRHADAMSVDPGRMLAAALAVLDRQRRSVRGDRALEDAVEEGYGYWRRYYGPALARRTRDHWLGGERLDAVVDVIRLARYAPEYLRAVLAAPQAS
jgi:glycosyltransferase involved in cell wall biosynthesis